MKAPFIFLPRCIIVASFCLASVLSAQEKNKLESWYTYWGLGYANPDYGDEVNDVLNDVENAPGVSHVSIGLDILGFYWPVSRQTIIGGIINVFGDRYEVASEHLQINGVTVAFSAMHFLSNSRGRGLFVRGDIGPARMGFESDFGNINSEWGFGVLIGGGYGLNISSGTRLLFNVNWANRRIEGENIRALGITVGGLF